MRYTSLVLFLLRYTSLVLFLFMFTTCVVYGADYESPDIASLNINHDTREELIVYGVKTIITRTIVCEIRIKVLPETPPNLYSKIVQSKKGKCPLVAPLPRKRQPKDIYKRL